MDNDTPWVHGGVRHKVGGIDCIVILTGPLQQANVFIPCATDHAGAFRDAKRIVEAVNSHASLTEAVRVLRGALTKAHDFVYAVSNTTENRTADLLEAELFNALTKAKELLK